MSKLLLCETHGYCILLFLKTVNRAKKHSVMSQDVHMTHG